MNPQQNEVLTEVNGEVNAEALEAVRKLASDEPMFCLRGRDVTSPSIVAEWIRANIFTAPAEKLQEALDIALKMRVYHEKKMPD